MTKSLQAYRSKKVLHLITTHARVVIALLLGILVCCAACSKPDTSTQVSSSTHSIASSTELEIIEKPAPPALALGLPIPPNTLKIRESDAIIRVETKQSLGELEKFFTEQLVDYETLRPNSRQLHFIGLREHMPSIFIRRFPGATGLVVIEYRSASIAPWSSASLARHPSGSSRGAIGSTDIPPAPNRQPGMPVLDRTPEGELVAPGARWGEPYTPPENTYLHREHDRSNWGMPYGKWAPR